MYDDDKTWKQHYDDWKTIILTIKDDSYRKKVFQRLIKDYEMTFAGQ